MQTANTIQLQYTATQYNYSIRQLSVLYRDTALLQKVLCRTCMLSLFGLWLTIQQNRQGFTRSYSSTNVAVLIKTASSECHKLRTTKRAFPFGGWLNWDTLCYTRFTNVCAAQSKKIFLKDRKRHQAICNSSMYTAIGFPYRHKRSLIVYLCLPRESYLYSIGIVCIDQNFHVWVLVIRTINGLKKWRELC